jgi:GTP-binding protein
LLSVLTNAHPKIGNYPFTTLEPNLGVVNNLIISDIPGLIEGASKGKGLGDKFLKHVEKTKVLFHCIDICSENLLKDYEIIRNELKDYSEILLKKKEIVLLTKSDLIKEKEIRVKLNKLKTIKREKLAVSIYDETSLINLKKIITDLK